MIPVCIPQPSDGPLDHRSSASSPSQQSLNSASPKIPVMRPDPPRLSAYSGELARIEASGIYTNFGPVNERLERDFVDTFFGEGECLTVCNATLGLMIAIRAVVREDRPDKCRFALMPSFTFAAAAHAAIWAGLTPLLCDIDPNTWLPDHAAEELLLQRFGGQIAAIVPYATFGNNLDLNHYRDLSQRYGVPIVVDAAASLGSLDEHGRAFGSGFECPIVFSMHATKLFSTGEGGLIHCKNEALMRKLRAMASFGFEEERVATMLGINAKMTEVAALTASLQLERYADVVDKRAELTRWYAGDLSDCYTLQVSRGKRQAHAFESILLPELLAPYRSQIRAELSAAGIGTATYFSPHVALHPYFEKNAHWEDLGVTVNVASRILTLPMYEGMSENDVRAVVLNLEKTTRNFMEVNSRNTSSCLSSSGASS